MILLLDKNQTWGKNKRFGGGGKEGGLMDCVSAAEESSSATAEAACKAIQWMFVRIYFFQEEAIQTNKSMLASWLDVACLHADCKISQKTGLLIKTLLVLRFIMHMGCYFFPFSFS